MLYGMADLYMMGQFSGAAGITAVGNGAQTLYIITVTLVGLAMGTTVVVGHAVGSRRFDRVETAIGNTITLFMGVSVVLAAVLLALCPQIVALIGTPAEAVDGTAAYLRICFVGIPFIAAYNILSAIFAGWAIRARPCTCDWRGMHHQHRARIFYLSGTWARPVGAVALALNRPDGQRCPSRSCGSRAAANIHVKRSDYVLSPRCSAAF